MLLGFIVILQAVKEGTLFRFMIHVSYVSGGWRNDQVVGCGKRCHLQLSTLLVFALNLNQLNRNSLNKDITKATTQKQLQF